MAPTGLKCKECGHSYPLEALYVCERCFGPLEVAYDHSGLDATEAKRKIQAGPAGDLALRGLPAVRRAAARSAPARADAAGARRPARGAPRPRRALDQERRRQPDPLVQGPGRLRRAREGPRARLRDRRLRLDREPGERRRRPRRRRGASSPTSSSPPTSRSRSCSPPASTAPTWSAYGATTTTSTGSAPQLAETRPWAFVNVNLRPYYAEGSKTLAYETRRAARLGAARPGRLPDRLGLAVHQDRPWLPGVARPRPGRGRAAGLQRRPGARAAARSRRRLPTGWDVCKPQRPEHDREEPGDRRPGRRPLRARAGAPDRWRDRRRSPTTRSAPASACSPRRPGSSPRPRAG